MYLNYKDLNVILISQYKLRKLRWANHMSRMEWGGGARNEYKISVRKPLVEHSLTRQWGRRWEDNIKMVLREMGCEDGKWLEVVQDGPQWCVLLFVVLYLGILL
jgi:hypothetical protein